MVGPVESSCHRSSDGKVLLKYSKKILLETFIFFFTFSLSGGAVVTLTVVGLAVVTVAFVVALDCFALNVALLAGFVTGAAVHRDKIKNCKLKK